VSESAYSSIISANREGKIIHWNKAAERTFGYTSAEALGINGGAIIDHEAPRERRFVAVPK